MDFDLSEEQKMWQQAIHSFVAKEVKPKARWVDEESQFNQQAVNKMGSLGLLGLNISEEFGGAGVDFGAFNLSGGADLTESKRLSEKSPLPSGEG